LHSFIIFIFIIVIIIGREGRLVLLIEKVRNDFGEDGVLDHPFIDTNVVDYVESQPGSQ
jgi:hypothetical protein